MEMTPAEKILSLIETVDPSDTSALDEIDARVLCYLDGWEFKGYRSMHNSERMHVFALDEDEPLFTLQYTRSRDALKAIRPRNINLEHIGISLYDGGFVCQFWQHKEGDLMIFGTEDFECDFPTEELAELHAIIQAIEWERKNNG